MAASIKSLKTKLRITCEEVYFQQKLLKDVTHSKLSLGPVALQVVTSHLIEFS